MINDIKPEDHIWDDTTIQGSDHRVVGCRVCGPRPCPVHEPFSYDRWMEKKREASETPKGGTP